MSEAIENEVLASKPAEEPAELFEEEEKEEEEKKKVNPLREILSWVLYFAAAIVVAFLLNRFILFNANIVSGSMKDTLLVGDRVFGLRFAYWFHGPERGDVIIFDNHGEGEKTMVKRVIGLPGDTIGILDGVLYINGQVYDEPYLKEPMKGSFGPYEVPEGCYFLMGDNRNYSNDSRRWENPYIPRKDIRAKAVLVYWKQLRTVR